jgi:hypothetical protein
VLLVHPHCPAEKTTTIQSLLIDQSNINVSCVFLLLFDCKKKSLRNKKKKENKTVLRIYGRKIGVRMGR